MKINLPNNEQTAAAAKSLSHNDTYSQLDSPTGTKTSLQGSGGWWAAVDNKTGRIYYYNRRTGESGWQLPPGIDKDYVRINKKAFDGK